MENTEAKSSRTRKMAVAAILFLILVALPAGSWYYLRSGLNWHRKAVSELRHYGKVLPVMFIMPDGERFNDLQGRVCVVYNFGIRPDLNDTTKRVLDTYQRLFGQFGRFSDQSVRPDFRLVPLYENGTAEFKSYAQQLEVFEYAIWRNSGAVAAWEQVLDGNYRQFCREEDIRPQPCYYALADTSGSIRRFYNALDEKEIGRMVEHIALLLPKQ